MGEEKLFTLSEGDYGILLVGPRGSEGHSDTCLHVEVFDDRTVIKACTFSEDGNDITWIWEKVIPRARPAVLEDVGDEGP
jgi:hypothetical protein